MRLLPYCLLASILSAQPPSLYTALSRQILAPRQPLTEVQAYTAASVPPMPPIASSAEWDRYAQRLRGDVLNKVVFRGEAVRWREAKTRVEWLDTLPGPGYHVRKLRFEVIPGLWVPGLLYEPEQLEGKTAVVLNVNGHEGNGTAIPYIQERCINLAKRGLLALNVEWLGKGQLNQPNLVHYRMNQLDLCGTSGLALFYLSLKRSVDLILTLEHADPERLAVTGLSGGGWQTIFLSALDPRVRLANPVAGYSSYVTRAQFPEMDLGDSEQTPVDLATVVDYTHLTAMMAPRPTLLTYNARDNCCFRADYSVAPLLYAARPVFQLYDQPDRLRHHINFSPGHNYDRDSREAFYRMLRDFFYGGDPKFRVEEIPSEKEVRTAEQLRVELPAANSDFHQLAVALSRNLPRVKDAGREGLREIVRAKQFSVDAQEVEREEQTETKVTYWRLKMGGAWTVPAVELVRGEPKATAILVADGGRSSAVTDARRLLEQGKRVVAVDPFYFGESHIETRDYLFALLISALGDRPLGIQASQVAAVAQWLERRNAGPVSVVAMGPRSSLFALVAAALETKAIAGLELHESMASLKEVIEQNLTTDKAPELFCFGLLEVFDIPQLKALVAPRPLLTH